MMMGIHVLGEVPFRTVLIHTRACLTSRAGGEKCPATGNVSPHYFDRRVLRPTPSFHPGPRLPAKPRYAHRSGAGLNRAATSPPKLWKHLALRRDEWLRSCQALIRRACSETVNQWIVSETARRLRCSLTASHRSCADSIRCQCRLSRSFYDIFCDW